MHNDVTGKPLSIGDKVVYVATYSNSLLTGWISGFTPKRVRVAYEENAQGGTIRDPQQVAKVE